MIIYFSYSLSFSSSIEVVLLGQNVNSFWDKEALSSKQWKDGQFVRTGSNKPYVYSIADGFSQRTRVVSRGSRREEKVVVKEEEEDREGASDSTNGRKTAIEGTGFEKEENGQRREKGDEEEEEEKEEDEGGVRFAELLSLVAAIDPDNMRIRFQSPHPKDFPPEVIKETSSSLHLCRIFRDIVSYLCCYCYYYSHYLL